MSKREEEKFAREIKRNLEQNLGLLEARIHSYVEPKEIPSQLLFDYFIQQIRVRELDSLMPKHNLEALDNFEKWHEEKGIPVPDPSWLKQIREFWQAKATPGKKSSKD